MFLWSDGRTTRDVGVVIGERLRGLLYESLVRKPGPEAAGLVV